MGHSGKPRIQDINATICTLAWIPCNREMSIMSSLPHWWVRTLFNSLTCWTSTWTLIWRQCFSSRQNSLPWPLRFHSWHSERFSNHSLYSHQSAQISTLCYRSHHHEHAGSNGSKIHFQMTLISQKWVSSLWSINLSCWPLNCQSLSTTM